MKKSNNEYDPTVEQKPKSKTSTKRTLNNSTIKQAKDQVSDLEVFGNGNTFKLICKASSKSQGWFKSTKAMEIPGVGCVIQSSTNENGNVAEGLVFVPNTTIEETRNEEGIVVSRKVVKI